MKSLEQVLQKQRSLRVIGFDDAPFEHRSNAPVNIAGVVCANTRFEGMLWGTAHKDGTDATKVISELLIHSKFYPQVHLVLLDGLAVGGFNLVDLPALAECLQRPCVAVMRKYPDMAKIHAALQQLPDPAYRLELLHKAGEIHHSTPFYYQCAGAKPETVALALKQVTDQGHVPEALRLAHLIGAAVMTGESGKQA